MQGLRLLSELHDVLKGKKKKEKKTRFCIFPSVSCLLLAGVLSAAGMGFKTFHLLFAVTHLHMDASLT